MEGPVGGEFEHRPEPKLDRRAKRPTGLLEDQKRLAQGSPFG
jgi:hypothetical protein